MILCIQVNQHREEVHLYLKLFAIVDIGAKCCAGFERFDFFIATGDLDLPAVMEEMTHMLFRLKDICFSSEKSVAGLYDCIACNFIGVNLLDLIDSAMFGSTCTKLQLKTK